MRLFNWDLFVLDLILENMQNLQYKLNYSRIMLNQIIQQFEECVKRNSERNSVYMYNIYIYVQFL